MLYEGLVIAFRKELKKPQVLVNHLHRRFLVFYNILKNWSEYTKYLRMGAEELNLLMDDNIYQQSDSNSNPLEKLVHHSSDEELSTSEEGTQDIDIGKFKENLEERLQATESSQVASGKKDSRNVAHDSDYDTDQKSIDDTSMSTSDLDSSE